MSVRALALESWNTAASGQADQTELHPDIADGGGRMGVEGKWRFAMVCSSNMNRSMEAHSLPGLDVESYGTGAHVSAHEVKQRKLIAGMKVP
jgi:hypothetical protein